ncbi:N-terminal nucleophile aminohydrolase [Anaeromyces robustus]|uniref:N-terminal nucleophile aminohydrolase n=1 Tax=Anaeromyces robustus TaxID=1754192 RepID=A0A1Y1XP93_9FUNG|nr:N-terminal nucleophile aminohydrolase [Anaeromyces robustus]|eukprot:ORX87563.1 N-terminal nucleophile aminohydrolase [Anaeromyces robustus]
MYLKNLQIVFVFITFALLTLSSPIKNGEKISNDDSIEFIQFNENKKLITEGLSIVELKGYENFIYFLSSNDNEMINYALNITKNEIIPDIDIQLDGKSSSAFIVQNKEGNGYYFGKNYDLNKSNNLIVINHPKYFFSSISTVNTDFIIHYSTEDLSDDTLKISSSFAPLDGMNEKGVSISVNVVPNIPIDSDSKYETIDQNIINKSNISIVLYTRIVLDFAATADEAIQLLKAFNIHSTHGVNVNYIIADASGKSYVAEFIHNKLVVTESKVATNFYITEGEYHKFGSGLDKYDTINEMMSKTPNMSMEEVKNTLMATKDEETQYSVVYDLLNREAIYYIKGDYEHGFKVKLNFTPDVEEQNPLDDKDFDIIEVNPTSDIQELDNGTLFTEFHGDDGLNEIIKFGGFKTDGELLKHLYDSLEEKNNNHLNITVNYSGMACSAFSVANENGDGYFFGRNFDWHPESKILVVVDYPNNNDYASISTIEINTIDVLFEIASNDERIRNIYEVYKSGNQISKKLLEKIYLLYPFDGMNEKGVSVSINKVPGYWSVDHNVEGKLDINTGLATRLILNKASTTDEAVELLRNSNMHLSVNLNIHFTISDANGKTVVVEYSEDDIFITESKVVTNYYLTDDSLKQYNYDIFFGDRRYETLLNRITRKPNQNLKDIRNTLRSAEQMYTKWSIAFDQMKKEATYFISRNFDVGYRFKLLTDNKYQEEVETETLYSSSEEEDIDDADTSDITVVDEE